MSFVPRHTPSSVRNVAIIAHVDHGKTTLVDQLLRDTGAAVTERLMDSMSLEQERGITIMSKYSRIDYNQHVLNILDTPGHSDFGGEVERVLSMVDGVVLVVDATEGVMSQTKFVVGKAIHHGLLPVVVINKVDRPTSRLDGTVENEIFDLFVKLDASDEQLDYPLLFASAKEGWAVHDLQDQRRDQGMRLLLDSIVKRVPAPCSANSELINGPFTFEVNSIQTDPYVGRVVLGKVHSGQVRVGDGIKAMARDGKVLGDGKVTKLYCQRGLVKEEIDRAGTGDILWLAGIEAGVADTICTQEVTTPIQTHEVDPPTISMLFGANTSPLAGREGKFVTATQLKDRLRKEMENNVSIVLRPSSEPDSVEVHGRGELQLGIIIEQMRREGYELCVSPPKVLTKRCAKTGKVLEPVEEVTVDVELQYSGWCVEQLSQRKGQLIEFKDHGDGKTRLIFSVPSRGLLGFLTEIRTQTKGSAILNRVFSSYEEDAGPIDSIYRGKLVSMDNGTATAYALDAMQDRGVLFIEPGTEVYCGMVVGEHNRPVDLDVNPTRAKKMSNVRSVNADEAIRLAPPVKRGLEQLISYMGEDEMLEVTPTRLRLRKMTLDPTTRARKAKAAGKRS